MAFLSTIVVYFFLYLREFLVKTFSMFHVKQYVVGSQNISRETFYFPTTTI